MRLPVLADEHGGHEPAKQNPGRGGHGWPVIVPFDRGVIAVGAVVFAVLLALAPRYGFHRDELYFIECARHLQASYVDQPVLTPLVAWVSLKVFGVSLLALRMWPALAAWATVVLAGLTAREFGGGRRAQLLAAFATATMPVVLGGDHLFGPTAFDMLAWAALALVVAKIGRTGDMRWWPPAAWFSAWGWPTSTAWACSPSRWSSASCWPAAGGWC